MRGRARLLLLIGAIIASGGWGAKEAGIVDALASHLAGGKKAEKAEPATDPRVPGLAAAVEANAKETRSVKRLVGWLVRQEIRRQAREGGPVADPPEDVE